MTPKRRALEAMTREDLLSTGRALDLAVSARMTKEELQDTLGASKTATLDKILPLLSRDALKSICEALNLPSDGREKLPLVDRIMTKADPSKAERSPQLPLLDRVAPPKPAPQATGATEPQPPQPAWVSFPTIEPSQPPPPPATVDKESDLAITLEVTPRKPRLAWQGMERKELATAVPTQVVEIVWPGRAIHRQDEMAIPTFTEARGDTTTLPPNRLIWTNDNLVALQTLLDEKDPVTKDYRYRGKVDLVYIDPPFMVNNDFRADNSIDIELDDDVAAKKEPSLVEILAYKDTWRQGLDSFLSMLRRRLELLKDLLAPTGSIYVHLDWHAAHYVKVLMDELFGYQSFANEIVWKRTSSRAGTAGFNHIHDIILAYSSGPAPFVNQIKVPHDPAYVSAHYKNKDSDGRFRTIVLTAPGIRNGETGEPWRGIHPTKGRHWAYRVAELEGLDAAGLIQWPRRPGGTPELKQYLNKLDGMQAQSIWGDIAAVNSQATERVGYPTQKPLAMLERVICASSPPAGLVLDCFMGSGTTCEAAERLGRRWIGIDNGKYAIHLARKRLIQLHGQPRPPEKVLYDYVECEHCKNIERKEKPQRSPGRFEVRPFTVENMGVYQRAAEWQGFQTKRSQYRDEIVKIYGGEPVTVSTFLHGKKGASWIHVGPLDGPVSSSQVWHIAREAQHTSIKSVTVLSADFDTLSASDRDDIQAKAGVSVTIRVIPASAIDEVKRRLELQRKGVSDVVESMAVPAFYAPLSIVLQAHASGRKANVTLKRCEIDIDSFLNSQRPALDPITDDMTDKQKKKAHDAHKKWAEREGNLKKWLAKATTWQKFIDFWAIDWDYGKRVSPDGKPIFETQWQSFRVGRDNGDSMLFTAEFSYQEPGAYRVAARVTDVFGNDGIATAQLEVK